MVPVSSTFRAPTPASSWVVIRLKRRFGSGLTVIVRLGFLKKTGFSALDLGCLCDIFVGNKLPLRFRVGQTAGVRRHLAA